MVERLNSANGGANMPKSNPLITVGELTFTVRQVEAILEKAIDIAENVPHLYSPGAAARDLSALIEDVKAQAWNLPLKERVTSPVTGGIIQDNATGLEVKNT